MFRNIIKDVTKLPLKHGHNVGVAVTSGNLTRLVTLHTASNFNVRNKLPFEFVRPPKLRHIFLSGDNEGLKPVDADTICQKFEECRSLKTADETTKKLLSVHFAPKKSSAYLVKWEYIRKIQRHKIDVGSMETTVAALTGTIRNLQEHMKKNPRDKISGVHLKECIDKRTKFLKNIRKMDMQRFEWVLKELNIVYQPPPSVPYRIERKKCIREMTQKYCEDIRMARIAAYRDKLKTQQVEFLKEKEEKLKFIAEEEKALGLTSEESSSLLDVTKPQPAPVASNLLQIARVSEGCDMLIVEPGEKS